MIEVITEFVAWVNGRIPVPLIPGFPVPDRRVSLQIRRIVYMLRNCRYKVDISRVGSVAVGIDVERQVTASSCGPPEQLST